MKTTETKVLKQRTGPESEALNMSSTKQNLTE